MLPAAQRLVIMVWLAAVLAVTATASASELPRVAVLDFEVTPVAPVTGVDSFGRAFATELEAELVASRRFTVITRTRLNEVLEEIGLSETGLTDRGRLLTFGEADVVDVLLVGEVRARSERAFRVSMTGIEVPTGRIVFSDVADATSEGDFDRVAASFVAAMRSAFPVEGTVVVIDGTGAFVDVGTDHGVLPDDTGGALLRVRDVAGEPFPVPVGSFSVVQVAASRTLIEPTLLPGEVLQVGDIARFDPSATVPAQTRAPPASMGAAAFEVQPADAVISIDGSVAGTGSLTVDDLPPGTYEYRIEAEGFDTVHGRVEVTAGTTSTIEMRLQRSTGRVVVDVDPADAVVRLDGVRHAAHELTVEPGTYALEVTAAGFEPFTQRLIVTAGQIERLEVQLQPEAATLALNVDAPQFNVQVNDRELGSERVLTLPPGTHQLRIEAPDRVPSELSITLAPGESRELDIRLTREPEIVPFERAPSYITIENVSLAPASGGSRRVSFDISWPESWRGPDRPTWVAASDNWDAAWVFVKYRVDGGAWQHATLAGSGHVVPSGAVLDVPSDRVGAFVYRSKPGYGTFTANGVGLQWDYAADGVPAGANLEVQPFAIEMVFVPEGSFSVGSPRWSMGEFRAGGTGNTPFVVSSQSSITLGDAAGQLMWTASTYSGSPSGSTNASFPTGYEAFYMMKYQVTQGQYVNFLNTLSQDQADARKHTGSDHRYAITGDSMGSYTTSLPFVAMNYISWADGAAFADWAGLRPMTELEFEKAARGPVAPVANEYAWGSTSITQATGLSNAGTINETPTPAGANAQYGHLGFGLAGPVRVGSFSAPGRSRRDAGAGYYGALELSGNLLERPVTVGNAEGRAFTGAHGDGTLNGSGNANVFSWPSPNNARGAGFRGGYWFTYDGDLRVSDRIYAANWGTGRRGDGGWRGARSAP